MVEIEKEKDNKKIERQTTGMFPSRKNAPTEKSYIQVGYFFSPDTFNCQKSGSPKIMYPLSKVSALES